MGKSLPQCAPHSCPFGRSSRSFGLSGAAWWVYLNILLLELLELTKVEGEHTMALASTSDAGGSPFKFPCCLVYTKVS